MLFIEEILYMILKVLHYERVNMASLYIGMTSLIMRYCRLLQIAIVDWQYIMVTNKKSS